MPEDVKPYPCNFLDLAGKPLAIPDYQRGFVWHNSQIIELAEDLAGFAEDGGSSQYYMGTVLLYCSEDGKKEIIDGQQRITALSILHYHLEDKLPQNNQDGLRYSQQSKDAIQNSHEALRNRFRDPPSSMHQVFEKIKFTVVEVTNLDQAFSFFDTQNNRGIPLHATDLMKAYHLRHLDSENDQTPAIEELQRDLVHRWLRIQNQGTVLRSASNFAHSLFENFLWRGRKWHGGNTPPARHGALLEEFQSNCRPPSKEGTAIAAYPVYPGPTNQFATQLRIDAMGSLQAIPAPRPINTYSPEDHPFSLRQPLYEGAHFFLFAEKYAALVERLGNGSSADPQLEQFRQIDSTLVSNNSPYLRRVFMVASLLFLDQFGTNRLPEFALWLECLLGAVRLNQGRIVFQTASKFVTGDKRPSDDDSNKGNLYDLIAHSFDAEQVIQELRGEALVTGKIYSDVFGPTASKDGANLKGVQGRYRQKLEQFAQIAPDFAMRNDHPNPLFRSMRNVPG